MALKLSFDNIQSLLRAAINQAEKADDAAEAANAPPGMMPIPESPERGDCCWIRDTFADVVVYSCDDEPGVYYRRPYSIDDKAVVTLGAAQKVILSSEYKPASFTAEFSDGDHLPDAGNMVELSGKLFEAGEYPDKGLTVTEPELAAMAEGFLLPEDAALIIEAAATTKAFSAAGDASGGSEVTGRR